LRAFAAAAVLYCANASATTIVAIWTPDRLVISGDSLLNMNWTGANGQPRHGTSTGCKIHQFGSNYISAAGNYHIQSVGFDVWESAVRACGSFMNVEACAAKFKTELSRGLSHAVGTHDVHLTVIIAGRQNGAPALEHLTFVGSPGERLKISSESFRKGRQTYGRVILGDRDAIDRYERGAVTSNGSIQDMALSLVKIEARAAPQEVGGPVSTLTIDRTGERWTNPGCCPSACEK
jgi:hypothetical protein